MGATSTCHLDANTRLTIHTMAVRRILSDGYVPVIEQAGIAENFQIVHYRRRGSAGSSRAVAGMTMQGWAGDCIALLNHLGIASAHVADIPSAQASHCSSTRQSAEVGIAGTAAPIKFKRSLRLLLGGMLAQARATCRR